MSENSVEHLVKMANQIVVNIPAATPQAKVASATTHMDKFWSPLMKKKIGEFVMGGGEGLTPEAAVAVEKIAK